MRRCRYTLAALLVLTGSLSAAPWIVFTEVHYHPPEGSQLEFVELFNLEAPRVDLSGWAIDGEVRFRFPRGTVLPARGHLVVAADPEALSRAHPSLAGTGPARTRVVGPFEGRLDNAGGPLILRTPTGAVAAEMRYGSRGAWSAVPDGTGHSLVLADPFLDPLRAGSWRPSADVGGTPGQGFADPAEALPAGEAVVREGETWRFFRGLNAPPRDWQAVDFDDSSWESGPGGFGFGDDDDRTVLADMPGRYLSVYTRHRFFVDDPDGLGELVLRADYDDGFLAYLNGREIARANLGPAGSVVDFRSPARGNREAGTAAEHVLGPAARFLREGENVLAVQAHNVGLTSTDLSLIVGLWSREPADDENEDDDGLTARPRLNEVSLAGDWIEVFNPSDREVDLAGAFLSDDPENLRKVEIRSARRIPPGAYLVLEHPDELAGLALKAPDVRLFLTGPAGRVIDAWHFDPDTRAEDPEDPETSETPERFEQPAGIASRGRYPDGTASAVLFEDATPGRPNLARSARTLVINEIMYQPMTGQAGGEYVEILNPGTEAVELDGYSLQGGVRHDFESGRRIGPDDYLVVARDPRALIATYGLTSGNVVGPFRGSLSNRQELVTLVGPPRGAFPGKVVDSVTYASRAPWPIWADGAGSSLELVHPETDNALPQAWAASDGARGSAWQSFVYTKELVPTGLSEASSLQFMLLDAGACLIDDVRLSHEKGEQIVDDSFEEAGSKWVSFGTHEASHIRDADPRDPDSQAGRCFELVAAGRGNPRHNYVSLTLPKLLDPRQTYRISFRARWFRGSPLLLSRTAGQGLAKLHRLAVPPRAGTPGRRNSRYSAAPGPIVGVPRQSPVAPSRREPVTISVPIFSREGIADASILYRLDGARDWSRAPLAPGTEGDHRRAAIWHGTIPALGQGKVEFHLVARDTKGLEATFPRDAPDRTALYAVGPAPRHRFPAYTVLVPEREWRAFQGRQTLSNRPMDATLVYGDRIFYNVDFRLRGSPFTRRGRNWRLVFGAETLDGRKALTFDGQATNARERLAYWLLGELHVPTSRLRYVHVDIPGQPGESGVYEEVEKVDGTFLARWFEDAKLPASEDPAPSRPEPSEESPVPDALASPGLLHKVDDHWELLPPGEHRVRSRGFFGNLFGSRQGTSGRSYVEAFFRFTSTDPEDYRWNFPPRANGTDEDFDPLIGLVRLLDPRQTPDDVFASEVETQIDVDEWLRVLAARTAVNDWDSIGLERGKNAYLYRSPTDGRWRMIPWDADLSWSSRSPYSPFRSLFSRKFMAIRRLLAHPPYRRQFLSYLAFLVRSRLGEDHFAGILADLGRRTGGSPGGMREFAAATGEWFESQVEIDGPFTLERIDRISVSGGADVVRLGGVAPLTVQRLELDGREGSLRFLDDRRWIAEFQAGPDGGVLELRALDFGGEEVATVPVAVPAG